MSNSQVSIDRAKSKGKNKKLILVGSLMNRMGGNSRGKANLKRCVLIFEQNVDKDNKLWLSGGREFQSHGARTEKVLSPKGVWTYGMNRIDESDDLVDREWDSIERLLWRYVGCWIWRVFYVGQVGAIVPLYVIIIIIIIKVSINPFLQMFESGTIVLLFTCVCNRK